MVIGHQKQWNFLKKAAESKRFSHAYLFAGQEKLGKKTLALEWVSFLTEPRLRGEEDKSSSSPTELPKEAKVAKRTSSSPPLNNHPDLTFIRAETKEIQISQIRNLIWKLSLKPSLSFFKTAIIDDAHLMNQEAQTSLLKTLEEPRGNALLILISDKAQYLFPTILSRVQIIKFNSVKKEEIRNYLLSQGISEKETEEISDIALGRPGIALDLISDRKKLENFSRRITEFNKISNSPFCLRFQYVKNLVKEDKSSFPPSLSRATAKGEEESLLSSPSLHKSSVAEDLENIEDTLDIWLNYLRNILLSRFNPRFTSQKPGEEGEKIIFFKYPTLKIKNIINRIQTTKFLLSNTNTNPRLALETLMIELN